MGQNYSIRSSLKEFTMGYSLEFELDVEEQYLYYLPHKALITCQTLFLVIYKY